MRRLSTVMALGLVLLPARGAAQGRRITTFPYLGTFSWVTSATTSFPITDSDGGELTLDAVTTGWTSSITSHGLNNNGGAGGAVRIQTTASIGNGAAGLVWWGDFTGNCGDSIALDWRKVANSTSGTRTNELRVATNGGGGAAFTDIPLESVAGGSWPTFDNSATAQSGTLRARLPAALGGNADVRIRIYSLNTGGSGGQPRVAIDNLSITTTRAPEIVRHPAAQIVCGGATARFAMQASGDALSYQWRRNGVPIPGATSATLAIDNASYADAADYDVVVEGVCSGAITSRSAPLMVLAAPVIIRDPVSESVCRGEPIALHVYAVGSGLRYQWRKDGKPIAGATSEAYVIERASEADAGLYDVTIGGSCPPEITSGAAQLTVKLEPVIAEQPLDQTSRPGLPVTFTVRAYGNGSLRYQWQKNGVEIPGATSSSYTIRSVSRGDVGGYSCVIGNLCTPPMTVTNNAWLFVSTTESAIGPETESICEGEAITLAVPDSMRGERYRWWKDGVDIAGADGPSIAIAHASVRDGGRYYCAITPAHGSEIATMLRELRIVPRTAVKLQPEDRAVCPGASATFTISTSGADRLYQWRRNGESIPGANDSAYTIAKARPADAGRYDCEVRGSCGEPVTTRAAELAVSPSLRIIGQPESRSVTTGQTARFVVATVGGERSYQWRKDGVEIMGATEHIHTIDAVKKEDAGLYDVLVRDCAGTLASDAALLRVEEPALSVEPRSDDGDERWGADGSEGSGASTGADGWVGTDESNGARGVDRPTSTNAGAAGEAILVVTPNPTDGTARLEIRLPHGVHAADHPRLLLFDLLGARVADLTESLESGGWRTARLDAAGLPSGSYYCRLVTAGWSGTLGVVVVQR